MLEVLKSLCSRNPVEERFYRKIFNTKCYKLWRDMLNNNNFKLFEKIAAERSEKDFMVQTLIHNKLFRIILELSKKIRRKKNQCVKI